MQEPTAGFFVAPYSVDGESQGVEYFELAKLSAKWLSICGEFLDHYGDSFDSPWSGTLSHITTKFTAASGAALVTFRVRERPAVLIALASGLSQAQEDALLKLFVDSLRRLELVRAAAELPDPFQSMLTVKERPLMVVVPWPDDEHSEQDRALVRELAIHTCGAFFNSLRGA